MGPIELQLVLLSHLDANGRQSSDEVVDWVLGQQIPALGYDEVKAALDSLNDAKLVVAEFSGEVYWRASPQGLDYLAGARG
ncbi:MAG: hypothetical protein QOI31_1729 [Solirubrobacterales bacterium]|jgi:hypothetical protein|nr:hypothetical protein [Solirubrobacterales bacterium]